MAPNSEITKKESALHNNMDQPAFVRLPSKLNILNRTPSTGHCMWWFYGGLSMYSVLAHLYE